jgi:hypothetical protein
VVGCYKCKLQTVVVSNGIVCCGIEVTGVGSAKEICERGVQVLGEAAGGWGSW